MSDSVFRDAVDTQPEVLPEGKEPTRSGDEGEVDEVPYLDYKTSTGHPYSVDKFKLGDTWEDPVGGYPEEIKVIEDYFKKKIESGELANSINAINEEYKQLEKVTGMKKEERKAVKIETIAAYVKFLNETDNIKLNLSRYRG